MSVLELLRWQWEGYARYHRSRVNLLLHMVVVPLFLICNVLFLIALGERSGLGVAVGAGGMVLSVAAQGSGHRREPMPPAPFTGPLNAVARVFFEQWVTFPRFVCSGGWMRAVRQASAS